jgi:hypothetical protein
VLNEQIISSEQWCADHFTEWILKIDLHDRKNKEIAPQKEKNAGVCRGFAAATQATPARFLLTQAYMRGASPMTWFYFQLFLFGSSNVNYGLIL